jgi:hypothetical protein
MEIKITHEELQKKKLFLASPMFGGMCAGIYNRSISDLTAVCMKYGIEMKFYSLFNESLIPRARNYCVDEFLRSDSTHFLFVDADIGFNANDVIAMLAMQSDESPYDVLAGPYPKKSIHKNAKILTEDGYKKIKWIVDNKYNGKVLTIDDTGKTSWNNILEHHLNPNNNKWVEVKLSKHPTKAKKLIMTYDHEISYVEDLFNPTIQFKRVDEMVGKYTSLNPENVRSQALYNTDVVSALIGTLMGDSHISGRYNRLSCSHGEKQKEYLEYKQNLFGGTIREYKSVGYSTSQIFQLSSIVNGQTKYARELFFENNEKTVKNIIPYINDIALAFWYMDDGCLKKSGDTAHYCELNTQGFSDEDQLLLVEYFKNTYGFNVRIDEMQPTANDVTKRTYKRLRFVNGDADKFFQIISKHIPEHMQYKLPEKYRNSEFVPLNNDRLEFAATKIESVEKIDYDSDQYDIGVENNHNFLYNTVFIRNCISWEKIKMAVDKGFADDDPENLNKYVGDYVFNPAGNTTHIQINEPAEVMETGTGFMMIRRKTFDLYKEAYPQYSYKPDHVRTDAFDGSREITAYFDCIIDPETKRYLSEDYFFCQNVRKMGGKVWLCPWIALQHVGSYIFGGTLADLAQLGASATADVSQLKKNKKITT